MIDSPPTDRSASARDGIARIALIALALVGMGRICGDEFSWWDDPVTLHQNPWMHPPTIATLLHYWTHAEAGLYIPLTYTLWAGIAWLAQVPSDPTGIGLNPWLFHGTSVALHVLGTLVCYRIIRTLEIAPLPATFGAAMFAVHPIQVEAVAWASGLKDVLSGLLGLIATWQYLRFVHSRSRKTYVLATLAFAAAMLAKPSVMALPVAMILIDRSIARRPWREILTPAALWLAIALPLAIVARIAQTDGAAAMPAVWLRPLVAMDSLAFYLGHLAFPSPLCIDYGRNAATVLGHGWCYWDWIFPSAALGGALLVRRRQPVLICAVVVFIFALLPTLGMAPALFAYRSTVTDHYLYLAMLGPAIVVACLVANWPMLRWPAGLALMVLLLLTARQAANWRDDLTLFTHETTANPASYVGFMNLAACYERAGDPDRAVEAYRHATAISPDDPDAWGDLADVLARKGNTREAIAAVRLAIDLQTRDPRLSRNREQNDALLRDLLSRAKGN